MRPVNLIPPEERRGDKAPARTGPLAYVIVAALAAALLAVTAVVLTNNQISDREAEKASLEAQVAEANAEAEHLRSFADFASLQQARELTVASLAQSRFDWERVLRSLAIVVPDGVWLTNLSASVSSSTQAPASSGTSSASATPSVGTEVTGPSLRIQGCASGHQAVAKLLAALGEIDGVTRVSVLKSDRPDASASPTDAASTTGSDGATAVCSSHRFVSQFEVAAAFDAVQLGATPQPSTSTTPLAPTSTAPTSTAQPTGATTTASAADGSQVSDAEQQLQRQKDSAARQTGKADDSVNTFVPGTGSAP